jgi:heptosyltransferase I
MKDFSKKNKICILRLSAIGDCCHVLGAINALRNHDKDADITWIIGKNEYQIFREVKGVTFQVIDKKNLIRSIFSLWMTLKNKRFDTLLNMHASLSANLVSLVIRATRRIGFDKKRSRDGQRFLCNDYIYPSKKQHQSLAMCEFINHLYGLEFLPVWEPLNIYPEDKNVEEYIDNKKITCLISPCSSQKFKSKSDRSWPVENFISVIKYLSETKNIQVIVSGGKSEIEVYYSKMLNLETFNNNVINLIGNSTLREMASLIKKADFVISPDSGPAHVATIMDTPIIGLYALTNPQRSGPFKSLNLTVDKYKESLKKYENKTLDQVKWDFKLKHPSAMALITPEELISNIERLLVVLKD